MTKQYGNEYRTTLLCVDSYENSVLKGRYYNPGKTAGVRFESTMEFLLSADNMLDQARFPQAFSQPRTFSDVAAFAEESPEGTGTQTGGLATFHIKVLFRQNASWQGVIHWLDGRKEEGFRSVLELLILMDSALKTVSA